MVHRVLDRVQCHFYIFSLGIGTPDTNADSINCSLKAVVTVPCYVRNRPTKLWLERGGEGRGMRGMRGLKAGLVKGGQAWAFGALALDRGKPGLAC